MTQSVVIGGTALIIGFLLIVLGIIGDLIATNRLLIEETLYQIKRQELTHRDEPELDWLKHK